MSECTEQVDWLSLIEQDAAIATLSGAMEQGGTVRAAGRSGFSSVVVAAALQRFRPAPRLLVVAHIDEADEAVETLGDLGIKADRFPALEVLPGERVARMDLLGDRLSVVRSIGESPDAPRLLVAPIHALMQTVPGDDIISTTFRVLRPGESIEREALLDWLVAGGYQRVMTVEEQGEFAFRGDILDVFPLAGAPTRLDLEDDQISAICSIDLDTMGSEQHLDRLDLITASINPSSGDGETRILLELLDDRWELMLDDLGEVSEQGRSYFHRLEDQDQVVSAEDVLACASRNLRTVLTIADDTGQADEFDLQLPIRRSPEFPPEASAAFEELAHRGTEDEIVVCCRTGGDATRFQELLDGFVEDEVARSRIRGVLQDVPHGFRWAPAGRGSISIISYDELISRVHMRRRGRARNEARPLDAFVDIEPGDFVVHREHGIASFAGLRVMARGDGPEEEFLTLEFARGSRLHVPAVDIELVQKYIGAFKGEPERSLLGGKSWARRKEKASDSVRELAHQMLSIQAARQSSMGMTFPPDTEWQHEFEAAFPWDETEDQLQAITAIKEDMQSTRPMDRLLCGDVGFGKTEVAIRAGFKAVESGRQVAVLVPTTVLAEQHDRTFSGRFAGFPFRVESLSRFKNAAAQRAVLEALASGEIDVLVGTHRILSSDVRFRNLGLVVIDEEQRFGVAHKQKLLQLRSTVDVLTMTATPIPRTLHMSMLGLRDISSLTTPPQDRRAVVTELISWDTGRIRDALRRELAREGQAFFVHNRVRDLDDIAHAVRTMVPGAEVVVGHGQMRPAELESVMLRFMRGEADILVCTTIIESGIDIPSANTMIINEADLYGLADLHQLRGRVGRFRHRAYCYLVLPRNRVTSEVAMRRLRALESFSMLGAGFRIALRDLEMRGAGNLLGAEQSGHIAAVGYELYCRLLEQAVEDLKAGRSVDPITTTIDLGIEGIVSVVYVPSNARRMDVYRRLARAGDRHALEEVIADIVSAYGPMPGPVESLADLSMIRVLASGMGIRSIRRHEQDIIFRTSDPARLEKVMDGAPGRVRLVGGKTADALAEVYYRPSAEAAKDKTLLAILRKRLGGSAAG